MKKFKGTRYAHIGTSYTPALDSEIAKVETSVMAQLARLVEITKRVEDLLGLDPEEAFEQLLTDNKDVLVRLKTKDTYTVEDFLASWGE